MKILTHNVYWFQGHPTRWGAERVVEVPKVVEALAALYRSLAPDLLCLQEVHRPALADTLARELGMTAWLHAPGGLRPDYGGTILSRRAATLEDRTRAPGLPPHERVHLRATLATGHGSLEVAMVHLPSNRFAGTGPGAGEAARMAELRRVLSDPPRPAIVLGDMNCRSDSAPCRLMAGSGYIEAGDATGTPPSPARRVDYIWIDRAWAGRAAAFAVPDGGAFARTSPGGQPWRLSDHPPLLLELA